MPSTYRAVMLTKKGGPEVLQVVELPIAPPGPGELGVRVGAAGMLSKVAMFSNLFVGARLRCRRGDFYGISALYRKDPKPLREDLPRVFALLKEKKIDPLVTHTFKLLEARQAIELLATDSVEGKIVLVNSE